MKHFFIIFLISISISSLRAEEIVVLDEELQTLLTLDLEDLTTVSVASKRSEAIEDAPGIITVITAAEIQRYGYRNLRDVLDRQTHMQVVGSNLFPHDRISLRGSTFTHTDNTVLPLLNGRPIRDATSVSNNHDLYNAFPVEAIKQIEIIRGPGSVLYGTNAFAGVINIITKDAPDEASGNLALSYGSFGTKKVALSGGGKQGDFEFFGAVNGLDSQGDNFNNLRDELGTPGTYKTGISAIEATFQAKYKGLTVNGLVTDTLQDHGRSTFIFPTTDFDSQRQFIDVGYKHNLTDNWDVAANFSYNHLFYDFFLGGGPLLQVNDNENFLYEITTQAKLTEDLTFLAGGTYNWLKNTIRAGNLNVDIETWSGYAQVDYQFTDWLKLIGGVQYNKPEDVSGDFSPRFAAIAHLNDQWGMKVLYGEAFRNSSPVERFINVPQVVGDPSLEPEQIKTWDVQVFYNGKKGSASVTYFHSEQSNLITRVGILPQQIVNSGEAEFDGFELEGKWKLGHGFSFIGNLSYQTNEKSDGNEDATYAPDVMLKTGLSYESQRGYSLSLFNSYFAAPTLQNQDINPTVLNINPDADSYNLLTANLNMNVGKFLNDQSFSHVNFTLYGDNLLDEDIFFPSMSRVTINSIPHHQGRGIYGTVRIDF